MSVVDVSVVVEVVVMGDRFGVCWVASPSENCCSLFRRDPNDDAVDGVADELERCGLVEFLGDGLGTSSNPSS